MNIKGRFKSYFLRGLAVLLPTIVTICILIWGYKFIDENISCHITNGLNWLIKSTAGKDFVDKHLDKRAINIVLSVASFLVAVLIVCIVGALLASVIGRTLWRTIEKFIMNTPFLKQVYPYVKQVTDFLFSQEEKKKIFSRVVAVEYPRKGMWAMGFVTGSGLKRIIDKVERKFLTVLVPTSPTPFSGLVVIVPEQEAVDLDMTIEEALRFIVSDGVIAPPFKQDVMALPKIALENKGDGE